MPWKYPLISVDQETRIPRIVYSFLVLGDGITLIDSGVAGAEKTIFTYLESIDRKPEDIQALILSHSHPDHIGSAPVIQEKTGCRILGHAAEQSWIEDTDKQEQERPVPGFRSLVSGPVHIDALLEDGETLSLDSRTSCRVFHTPGHSPGSLSLYIEEHRTLFTGDALPYPGDLPIYDDISVCMQSIKKLFKVAAGAEILLSSWEPPVQGNEQIRTRFLDGIGYLEKIHTTFQKESRKNRDDVMELCKNVVAALGLPPFAANPLVAKSLASSLNVTDNDLFST